jgi:hypothetical protein
MKGEWTGDNALLEQELLIIPGSTLLEPGVVLLDGLAKGAGRFTVVDKLFLVTKVDQGDLVERKAFFA